MKVHPLVVSRNIAELEEQLDLEIWLLYALLPIRTQHLIVWNKAQVTISSYAMAWCLNVFISFQGYILFISFFIRPAAKHHNWTLLQSHWFLWLFLWQRLVGTCFSSPFALHLINSRLFLKVQEKWNGSAVFQAATFRELWKTKLFSYPTKHSTTAISVLTILRNSTAAHWKSTFLNKLCRTAQTDSNRHYGPLGSYSIRPGTEYTGQSLWLCLLQERITLFDM